ncbi:hypothetical protein PHISCL_10703, partial [Aspergillus sclerotialis]
MSSSGYVKSASQEQIAGADNGRSNACFSNTPYAHFSSLSGSAAFNSCTRWQVRSVKKSRSPTTDPDL